MTIRLALALSALVCAVPLCFAELQRIETISTEPFATGYQIVTAKAHFAFDPRLPANKAIVDLGLAPRNAKGLVEASADLVLIQPTDPARANGTTLFEVSNRGSFSALVTFNGSRSGQMEPGNEFLMRQGYTLAWLGWQFGLPPTVKFRIRLPTAHVTGRERWYTFGTSAATLPLNRPGYCAAASAEAGARLYTRASLASARQQLPASKWDFADPCTLRVDGGFQASTLYELVYDAQDSPVAGAGLAAVRDFISWMKTKNAPRAKRAIAYGYSQSARMMRQMVYDGFNADEQGRIVFDGLLLAAGGAGRGSFNHRFADPGIAGNSTEGFDEPVDIFPFTDNDETDPVRRRTGGLLHRAAQQHAIPKMFHLLSATEYWARAGSLLHTSVDGKHDFALPESSRLYFFAGTPHAAGSFPPVRKARANEYEHLMNPYPMNAAFPALLVAMQAWLADSVEPPPSRYPTLAKGDLIPVDRLTAAQGIAWPTFVPQVTRLDFGAGFENTGVLTKQPPARGAPYPLLVPQVDADGNETSGVHLPHVAVPLGAFTGWNQPRPAYPQFSKLGGLTGSYIPFAPGKAQQRYASKAAYLEKIRSAAEALVKDRFLLPEGVQGCVDRAAREWDWQAAAR